MAAPVLTLQKTITDRQYLTFEGQPYDLRRRNQVSIMDELFLGRALPRLGELMDRAATQLEGGVKSFTTDEEAELSRLLRQVVAIALVAPEPILASLSDVQRVTICHVFLELPTIQGLMPEAPKSAPTKARSTGKRSARGSSGSTRGTR